MLLLDKKRPIQSPKEAYLAEELQVAGEADQKEMRKGTGLLFRHLKTCNGDLTLAPQGLVSPP